jgi:hypothetical protein
MVVGGIAPSTSEATTVVITTGHHGHRYWVPGHRGWRNHHRVWIPGHWAWR